MFALVPMHSQTGSMPRWPVFAGTCDIPAFNTGKSRDNFGPILHRSVLPVGQLLENKNAFMICILHQCKLPNALKVEIPCCHGEHFDAKVLPIQKQNKSKSQGVNARPANWQNFFNH